ncbi:hypothetical protein KC325_g233 [Hortaea werneckii]|nr:hypothetical protein KC325_g233 [Hortaea werneckii]
MLRVLARGAWHPRWRAYTGAETRTLRKIVGGNSAVVEVERSAVEYHVRCLSYRGKKERILLAVSGMETVSHREGVEEVVDLPRNFSPVGSPEVCFLAVLQSSSVAAETMNPRRKSSAVDKLLLRCTFFWWRGRLLSVGDRLRGRWCRWIRELEVRGENGLRCRGAGLRSACGRSWCIFDREMWTWYRSAEIRKERSGITLGPEIDVQRVDLVEVLLLSSWIVGGKVPLAVILNHGSFYVEGKECWLLVAMMDSRHIQVAGEGILIWGAGMICDLQLRRLSRGILVDIDI